MSGTMVRSWKLMRAVFRVIRQGRKILIFPLLSGVTMVVLTAVLLGGMFITGLANPVFMKLGREYCVVCSEA